MKKIVLAMMMTLALAAGIGRAVAGPNGPKLFMLLGVASTDDQGHCAKARGRGALVFDIDAAGQRISEGAFYCLIEAK
jgi:hypothetical protein